MNSKFTCSCPLVYQILNNISNKQSILSPLSNYLPKYFSSDWSFAQFNLPEESIHTVGFFNDFNLLVITSNGGFYKLELKEYGKLDLIEYGVFIYIE